MVEGLLSVSSRGLGWRRQEPKAWWGCPRLPFPCSPHTRVGTYTGSTREYVADTFQHNHFGCRASRPSHAVTRHELTPLRAHPHRSHVSYSVSRLGVPWAGSTDH